MLVEVEVAKYSPLRYTVYFVTPTLSEAASQETVMPSKAGSVTVTADGVEGASLSSSSLFPSQRLSASSPPQMAVARCGLSRKGLRCPWAPSATLLRCISRRDTGSSAFHSRNSSFVPTSSKGSLYLRFMYITIRATSPLHSSPGKKESSVTILYCPSPSV